MTGSVGSGCEIISYEEVVKINPQVKRPRPIILVGRYNYYNHDFVNIVYVI